MATGYVTHKKPAQTYGFLRPSGGGNDAWWHVKSCVSGKIPREGDEVQYRAIESEKYPGKTEAVDVVILEREAA